MNRTTRTFPGRLLPTLSLFLLALALSACSGVPLSSYGKLLTLDPMSAEPSDMRVAIRVVDSVNLDSAKVFMKVSYVAEEDGINQSHELVVEPMQAKVISPQLENDREDNERLYVYRLSDADASTLRAFQKLVRDHREAGGDGDGELTVAFTQFCAANPLDPSDTPYAIYLKTAPEQDFFQLYGGQLDKLFEKTEGGLDAVPACESIVS